MKTLFLISFFALSIAKAQSQTNVECATNMPSDICKIQETIFLKTDFRKTEDIERDMLDLKQLAIKYDSHSESNFNHILQLAKYVSAEAHKVRAPKSILDKINGKENMRSVFSEMSEHIKKNGPIIPVGWRLPEEFIISIINADKKYRPSKNETTFRLGTWSILKKPVEVEQMQIIKYPNEVILDKMQKIGDWDEGIMMSQFHRISFQTKEQMTPLRAGLYLLKIKIKNQKETNGWFFLGATDLSTNEVIQSPQFEETFQTKNPLIKWSDYRSQYYSEFEQRKRVLFLSSNTYPDLHESFSVINPSDSPQIKIGQDPRWPELKELKAGTYYLTIRNEERSFFGDLMVGRANLTGVPFKVAQ